MTVNTLAGRLVLITLSALIVIFVVSYLPTVVNLFYGVFIAGTYIAHHGDSTGANAQAILEQSTGTPAVAVRCITGLLIGVVAALLISCVTPGAKLPWRLLSILLLTFPWLGLAIAWMSA
jgi:hypothetical protein